MEDRRGAYRVLVEDPEWKRSLENLGIHFTQYCAGNKIEKNEMDWACGEYG